MAGLKKMPWHIFITIQHSFLTFYIIYNDKVLLTIYMYEISYRRIILMCLMKVHIHSKKFYLML